LLVGLVINWMGVYRLIQHKPKELFMFYGPFSPQNPLSLSILHQIGWDKLHWVSLKSHNLLESREKGLVKGKMYQTQNRIFVESITWIFTDLFLLFAFLSLSGILPY